MTDTQTHSVGQIGYLQLRRRRVYPTKFQLFFASVIAPIMASVPSPIKVELRVFALFFMADTLLGWMLAAARRSLSSNRMRSMPFRKLAQYFGLVVCARGLDTLADTWVITLAVGALIIAVEGQSILETVVGFSEVGGERMDRIRPAVDKIGGYFEKMNASGEPVKPPQEGEKQ